MRIAKLFASSAAGFVVFVVAVVYVGGIAMAIPIPASYYAAFRPLGGNGPALAIVSLLVWRLPVAIVVGVGFFTVLQVLRVPLGLLSICCAAGMIFAFLVLTEFRGFAGGPLEWWGVPHVLAPWLGAAGAVLLSRRGLSSHAELVA